MKTATEKSIILKIEKDYQEKEELKREERKVFEWSSHDDNGGTENSSFVTDSTPPEQRHSTESDRLKANVLVKIEPQELNKNRRMFSNGAISIMDQIGKPPVGEFTPERNLIETSPQASDDNLGSPVIGSNLKVELI
jgi:hypothetical protein